MGQEESKNKKTLNKSQTSSAIISSPTKTKVDMKKGKSEYQAKKFLNECEMHNEEVKFFCTIANCRALMCQSCVNSHSHKKKEELSEILRRTYAFMKYLGKGACGKVFLVKENFDTFAIKMIDIFADIEDSMTEKQKTDFLEGYMKEVQFHRELRQQYIISYYDHFYIKEEERLVIKMEDADNSLNSYLEDVELDQALTWIAQICSGVNYLHNKNIIHRDLKPGNILVKMGKIKICDFGGAKLDEQTRVAKSKSNNDFFGTQEYLAPEIFSQNVKKFTKETDIWALGVIFFKMLNKGVHPFLYGEKKIDKDSKREEKIAKIEENLKKYEQNKQNFKKIGKTLIFHEIFIPCLRYKPSKRCDIKKLLEIIQQVLRENAIDPNDSKFRSNTETNFYPQKKKTEEKFVEEKSNSQSNTTKETQSISKQNSETSDTLNEKANKLYLSQQYEEALVEYEKAISKDPKVAKYHFNKAGCLLRLKRFDEALSAVNTCLKLDKNYIKAYGRKGMILIGMKDFQNALKSFKEGLALDPKNKECCEGLNNIKEEQEKEADRLKQKAEEFYIEARFKEAIRDLDKAISLYENGNLYILKSRNLFKLKEYEKALESAKKSLQIDSKCKDSYEIQGDCYLNLKKKDEAIKMYKMALDFNPSNKKVKNNLVQLNGETSEDLIQQCNNYANAKNFSAALNCLNKAIEKDRSNTRLLFRKAQIQKENNEKKEALLTLAELIKIDNSDPEPFLLTGNIFLELDEAQFAYSCFQQGLKLSPNNSELLFASIMTKKILDKSWEVNREGVELYNKEKYYLALNKFNEAIKMNNMIPNFHNNKANVLMKMDDFQSALESNKKCLELDKNFILAYRTKGALYTALNKKQEAEMAYKEGLKIDPTDEGCKQGLRSLNGNSGNKDLLNLLLLGALLDEARPRPQPEPLFFVRNNNGNPFDIFDILRNHN